MRKTRKLKFVWPKDGVKGKGHRGFFGRLENIVTGTGPDVFIAKGKSKTPIKPDWWGNWDSYHSLNAHILEMNSSYPYASRAYMRYDPHTRRYKHWNLQQDWSGRRTGPYGEPNYPRFTQEEGRQIRWLRNNGRRVDPLKMGKDWNFQGPNRFDGRHDWFWQEAHRIGENLRQGLPFNGPANPFLLMHQNNPNDLNDWIRQEI